MNSTSRNLNDLQQEIKREFESFAKVNDAYLRLVELIGKLFFNQYSMRNDSTDVRSVDKLEAFINALRNEHPRLSIEEHELMARAIRYRFNIENGVEAPRQSDGECLRARILLSEVLELILSHH